MKIAVVSDTHGCAQTWEIMYREHMKNIDSIIHAGDVLYHGPRNDIPAEYQPKVLSAALNKLPVPFYAVQGNCDAEVDSMVLDWPLYAPLIFLQQGDFQIVVQHGHTLSDEEKVKLAKRYHANLFISGHTHVPVLKKTEGVILLNPGSPAMSKRPDNRGTMAFLVDHKIQLIAIDNGEVLKEEIYG
ncbi:putative phosphoesterase [Sporomusaceae bacterium BoRhaA]|uniref:phosphodiesterase n=1 Tax=Pelorhabdus rhamnosifermentans TaxID=2772457 RepID=UPI001C061CF7|nr:phosphodiesterase [Pelorhabdus rhamnosifermentans]MBU2700264.1 putative phosphoesterase [Pelorhabdus rhamnosifermentans]